MKKNILFLLFAIVLLPKINLGCSCISPSSFCESITDSDGDIYPFLIILRGKVMGNSSGGKEIKIDQTIYGEVNQSEIMIKSSMCTLGFGELENGKEYVMALSRNDGDFLALGCAIFFLEIENEVVKGKIAPGVESIAYNDLGNLEDCGNGFDFFSLEKNILIYPNPTIDEIKIDNTSATKYLECMELKIFDSIGKELLVRTKVEGILPDEDWIINIQSFPAGLYLFKLSGKYVEKTFKVVKQ